LSLGPPENKAGGLTTQTPHLVIFMVLVTPYTENMGEVSTTKDGADDLRIKH
jgi:hypothetical protein